MPSYCVLLFYYDGTFFFFFYQSWIFPRGKERNKKKRGSRRVNKADKHVFAREWKVVIYSENLCKFWITLLPPTQRRALYKLYILRVNLETSKFMRSRVRWLPEHVHQLYFRPKLNASSSFTAATYFGVVPVLLASRFVARLRSESPCSFSSSFSRRVPPWRNVPPPSEETVLADTMFLVPGEVVDRRLGSRTIVLDEQTNARS